MIRIEQNFNFNVISDKSSSQTDLAVITLPQKIVDALYFQALKAQKADADTYGFAKGSVPLQYIELNFKPNIIDHLKEFLFTHCILKFLYQSLCKNKITLIGEPTLKSIHLEPYESAQFCFSLTRATDCDPKWKKLALKAPERKNYKDIDRQVETFLKEEEEFAQKVTSDAITIGDWVYFELSVVDSKKKPILGAHKDTLWIRISGEETDRDLQEIFIGKEVGEQFYSDHTFFQDYISTRVNLNYLFSITIQDRVPHAYFSLESFKHHFQLKNNKETHLKLIEVFSFRNDISQRRETVEATFKLLLKYYFVTLPKNILERQKQYVLDQVHNNPDYLVYKAQNDFKEKIRQLAEKQLKESIVIDTIAYQENIQVNHKDVMCYLNLIKRARTKEFIYFLLPDTKHNSQEIPLPEEILKQQCLREKTLNYVIKQLTKK